MSYFPILASLLVFLASMAGALRFISIGPKVELPYLVHSELSYVLRFSLILISIFFAFIDFAIRRKKINIEGKKLFVAWIYFLAIFVSAYINPDTIIPTILQIFGILAWAILGILIANSTRNREKAIYYVMLGYFLSNIIYIIITVIVLVVEPEGSFHPYNGRFIGPFVGSTAVAEIFFGSLLIGLALLFVNRQVLGILLILPSLWAIFATGVRSASFLSVILVLMALLALYRIGKSLRLFGLRKMALIVIVIFSSIYFLVTEELLQERVSYENILAEGRIAIWSFAMEEFRKAPFWGVGTRATFEYGISTLGVIYAETIAWHNTWIAILIENGVIGLIAYAAIIIIVSKYLKEGLIRWLKNPEGEPIFICLGSILAFRYIAMSAVEMNLYTALSPGVMFLWIIYGIIMFPASKLEMNPEESKI